MNSIRQLFRLIKMGIAFLTLSVFLINLSIFVFLNFPFVQKKIVDTLNFQYFNKLGVSVGLSSLEVFVFPSSLVVNDLSVSTLSPPTPQSLQSSSHHKPLLTSRRIMVSLDVTKSYLQRSLVVKSVNISGVDVAIPLTEDGTSIDVAVFPEKDPKDKAPLNLPEVLASLKKNLPPLVEVSSFLVNLENPQKTHDYQIRFKSLNIENNRKKPFIQSSFVLTNGLIKHPTFKEDFSLESMNSKVYLYPNGHIKLQNLSLISNFINANSHGIIDLRHPINALTYNVNVSVDSQNKAILSLLGIQSSGTTAITAQIQGDGVSHFPKVNGKASWKKATLNQFDLHDGETIFEATKDSLELKNISITTEKDGKLTGDGKFIFSGEFPFSFKAQATDFSFLELMNSLGTKTDFFEFRFSNPNPIFLSGAISPSHKKNVSFFMEAQGIFEAQKLYVPLIGNSVSSGSLPDTTIRLKLLTTNLSLDLSGSEATFKDSEGNVSVIKAPVGTVDYTTGDTRFKILSPRLNLSPVGYFLGSKTEGFGAFEGMLTGSAKTPLTFHSKVDITDFLFFSTKISHLSGTWGINTHHTFGKNLVAIFKGNGTSSPLEAQISDFQFSLSKQILQASGSLKGRLEPFLQSSSLPSLEPLLGASGQLSTNTFYLKGPLSDFAKWTLRTDLQVNYGHFANLHNFDADIFLDCYEGVCKKSSAHLISTKDIYSIQILISELSKHEINSQITFNTFPLEKALGPSQSSKKHWTSEANGHISLQSNWKNYTISSDLQLKNNHLWGYSFDPVFIECRNTQKTNHVKLTAQKGQIKGEFHIPQNFLGSLNSNIVIQSLDLSDFIPQSILKRHGFATITGSLSSQIDLDKSAKDHNILKHVKSSLSLDKVNLKLYDQDISVPRSIKAKLADGKLFFSQLHLKSQHLEFHGGGFTDLIHNKSDLGLELSVQLSLLKEFSPIISSAQGQANSVLRVSGPIFSPQLNGSARIKGAFINLAEYGPNIENLDGQFSINGNKLEINYLRATKGAGKLDLVGSLGLTSHLSDIALKATFDNTEFRIPMPVLQTLDSNISGEVTLTGTQKPYRLGGYLKILKARAFRDISCPDITSELSGSRTTAIGLTDTPTLELSLKLLAETGIHIQTQCFRGRVGLDTQITGTSLAPVLLGKAEIPMGQVNLLKGRFSIRQASLLFDNPVRIDPRADVQMDARIGVYNIFLTLEGPMSRIKVNLWTDPATLPKSDNLITQQDIIDMLSSGSPPNENSQRSTGRTVVNVFSTLFDPGFSGAVNQAFSKATLGLVETVHLEPLIENGEAKGRLRFTHNLGDRFNLGMEILTGSGSNATSTSLSGTLVLSENVNLLGGFTHKPALDKEQQKEFTGGMRFQFGSR